MMMAQLIILDHHLWGLRTLSHIRRGRMKSTGMNPIAPTKATKSLKKGINAAKNVINTLYTKVMLKRAVRLRLLNRDWWMLHSLSSKNS